jgi:hypothetical protein
LWRLQFAVELQTLRKSPTVGGAPNDGGLQLEAIA